MHTYSLGCVVAGATADAFTLFERLESQLEAHPGDAPYLQQSLLHSVLMMPTWLCRTPHIYCTRRDADQRLTMGCFCLCPGQLKRAAVELAKLWRLDKYLRRLDVRCLALSALESYHAYRA